MNRRKEWIANLMARIEAGEDLNDELHVVEAAGDREVLTLRLLKRSGDELTFQGEVALEHRAGAVGVGAAVGYGV